MEHIAPSAAKLALQHRLRCGRAGLGWSEQLATLATVPPRVHVSEPWSKNGQKSTCTLA